MGTELAFGIVGMALIGILLDWWLGTSPWILIGCLVVGIVGSGYNFIRRATAMSRKAHRAYAASTPAPPAPAVQPTERSAGRPSADPPAAPPPPAAAGAASAEASRSWITGEPLDDDDDDDDIRLPPDHDKY